MRYFILSAVIALCGCTTAYGPNTLGGGYKERKIDDDSYIVSFFGNGYTSEQQVWNYWIYRCAELTVENGYELFSLETSDKHALLNDPDSTKLVEFSMLEESPDNDKFKKVQYYYYSVTTYSSKAIVNMYKAPISDQIDPRELLDAKYILDELKPYVESKAKIPPPERKLLLIRATIEAAIKAKQLNEDEASELRSIEI